jgi:lipid-A-disaccharide synthase-like uncharacterized protein
MQLWTTTKRATRPALSLTPPSSHSTHSLNCVNTWQESMIQRSERASMLGCICMFYLVLYGDPIFNVLHIGTRLYIMLYNNFVSIWHTTTKTHTNELNLACWKLSFFPTTIQLSDGKATDVTSEEYQCLFSETTKNVWAKYQVWY